MARIELIDIAHAYGQSWALKQMTLSWSDGGAYALLGPSGCGKTTLLNIISGLIAPTQGKILFDGRDVTALEPQQRNIAQVFQFPVVYDTMSVYDNLAFPLRNRGWKEGEVRRRVHEIAEILELQSDLPRRAHGLAADVKQKISLGRGLVRPDVAAVLFDEPLTVIDPHVKWLLRRKLKQLHQQLNLSLIYVTHDQTEALTFADRVVVMTQGEVVQVGTAEALFESPAHRFVGHFIGSPGMNFLDCDGAPPHIEGVPIGTSSTQQPEPGAALAIGIRPEYLEVHSSPGPNRVPAIVTSAQDQGTQWMVQLQIGRRTAWSKVRHASEAVGVGPAFAYIPPDKCALYADDRRVA
ncbi:ABC transporter ATP-binding protein [Steroidobacter agaridevorans]|uniref:ABC transporter ATP-binding protein n=2 Tax=Steroidobacter agaridevorans TaxID=2695856 RepID=A0A829YHV2_9GAMM|nr:ABC transporter ATP-binding protein [Steroidobacter agaridevorans]GFE82985.1 ABC transporter ATP-binding protein [Steroidobacter agaridevorans]